MPPSIPRSSTGRTLACHASREARTGHPSPTSVSGRGGGNLDVSAEHPDGPLADPNADWRLIPAYVAAYEFGLTHHTSAVGQLHVSPSVFRHSDVIVLHSDNTPHIGAHLSLTWKIAHR